MYADRYARPGGINPGSLGIALGINAAVVAALMFAAPDVTRVLRDPPIHLITVTEPPPPDPLPPPPPKADPRPQPRAPTVDKVDPLVKSPPTTDGPVFPPLPPQPPVDPGTLGGEGSGTATALPVRPPPPVLVQPGIDPRYAGAFQPPYPPAEERAGRTGRAVVKVLIGVDGRVKQVEQVLATSDEFFRVTRDRALAKWRFTPATRDGIPVEAWKTMTVTFILDNDR